MYFHTNTTCRHHKCVRATAARFIELLAVCIAPEQRRERYLSRHVNHFTFKLDMCPRPVSPLHARVVHARVVLLPFCRCLRVRARGHATAAVVLRQDFTPSTSGRGSPKHAGVQQAPDPRGILQESQTGRSYSSTRRGDQQQKTRKKVPTRLCSGLRLPLRLLLCHVRAQHAVRIVHVSACLVLAQGQFGQVQVVEVLEQPRKFNSKAQRTIQRGNSSDGAVSPGAVYSNQYSSGRRQSTAGGEEVTALHFGDKKKSGRHCRGLSQGFRTKGAIDQKGAREDRCTTTVGSLDIMHGRQTSERTREEQRIVMPGIYRPSSQDRSNLQHNKLILKGCAHHTAHYTKNDRTRSDSHFVEGLVLLPAPTVGRGL